MSGHSKWANIKHKKGKADAERGKIFTKIGREIAIAVRDGGSDPAINGKLRGEILVPAEAAQAEIEAAALANPDVQRFTEGMTVRKIIIVKNKLVNLIVK